MVACRIPAIAWNQRLIIVSIRNWLLGHDFDWGDDIWDTSACFYCIQNQGVSGEKPSPSRITQLNWRFWHFLSIFSYFAPRKVEGRSEVLSSPMVNIRKCVGFRLSSGRPRNRRCPSTSLKATTSSSLDKTACESSGVTSCKLSDSVTFRGFLLGSFTWATCIMHFPQLFMKI